MRSRDLAWMLGLSAVAAAIATTRIGMDPALWAYLAAAAATGPLVVIDLREHRLPNAITLPGYPVIAALLALAAALDGAWTPLARALLAGAGLLAAYLLLHLVNRNGMGMGDVKLAGPIGMLLGWLSLRSVLWGTFLGFTTAAAWSLLLLATRRANRRSHIAFGPYMLLGLWLIVALGPS